ncbi:amidohydrolase family protein [Nocardioides stalactiti]|uniref:amidohydrolase family protein n=1 Tax=Nocardioides stalactiti TaxID=2755356 RepID=UPI001601C4ED|nr:amidohydrolase family protein [Nocardioides stalactiti]
MREREVDRVRSFWQRLELPGVLDLHVHFLPPPIERAVWREFDNGGEKIGRDWPIRYRQSPEERVSLLRDFGVRRWTTLPYAHKPGVASYLNDWSRDFALATPEVVRSATLYPEPEAASYVGAQIADGVEVLKIHLQVGEFHLDDPLLDEVWPLIEEAGTPVVVHAGSGPVGNDFTGPASTARLLARFPRLVLVIAHMGTPEAEEFLALAETHDGVHLDTSMAFTDFFASHHRYPRALLPRLADLRDRVVYGSDFPTLPFAYADQLNQLAGLGLGEEWLRAVCWGNAARLLGNR